MNKANERVNAKLKADMIFKKRAKDYLVDCPVCGAGKYGGLFERCCDNPECILYDRYQTDKCFNCGAIRRMCSC